MSDAVILAGGIARGAFEAGALAALLEEVPELALRTVVATSSGALNGIALASAIRSGEERALGARLERLWREKATASNVFDVSVRGIVGRQGVSTNAKLLALLDQEVQPSTGRNPVDLRVITTATSGRVVTDADGRRATTFEHVFAFKGEAFDAPEQLAAMFRVVTASCAIPGVFLPVEVDVDGERVPFYDGGVVDNSPVRHAIDDATVTRVFVIAPFPSVFEPTPKDRRGLPLVEHMLDVLVNERLYRDLKEAREVNRALSRLHGTLFSDARRAALAALGWERRRFIDLVELRPASALPGSAFEALRSRALREQYLAAGRDAARAWARDGSRRGDSPAGL